MQNHDGANFSQIVCNAHEVRAAFCAPVSTRLWWKLILALHGKPVDVSMEQSERIKRVAGGFRFYAWLYRLLSAVFLILCPCLVLLNTLDSSISLHWAVCCFLAATYLWCVSGLGFVGAEAYGNGQEQGRVSVLAFMVMIVAFLSIFIATISTIAHEFGWASTAPNLIIAGILFVFGVGSYMIEIVYLSTERLSC
jgi:hypothetical protein